MIPQAIVALAATAALALALPAEAATVTVQKAWTFSAGAPAGLEVDNLVGSVVVERHAGPGTHVTATVVAAAADDAAARRLADAFRFDTRDSSATQALKVIYPLRDYKAFYVAGAPQMSWMGSARTEYLGERVKLSGDRDDAADVHVDLLIRLPADAKLTVRNDYGSLLAGGVQGTLRFESGSAPQTVRDSSGEFRLDTGSGPVTAQKVSGRVAIDTGSGAVEVRECTGELKADTGSGGVRVFASSGSLDADTGSGGVSVDGFKGSVKADTGSGAVRVSNLSGAEEVDADTGSGSVRVQGDLAALRRLHVDTGSGSVEVVSATVPSLELIVDTGSGGIEVAGPTTSHRKDDDGRDIYVFGSGEGHGMIDTGSGSVTVRLAAPGQGPAN